MSETKSSERRYRRNALERRCIHCGESAVLWTRPRDTREMFDQFVVRVSAAFGIEDDSAYPSSRRGRKTNDPNKELLSHVVDCYIAWLHHEGHAQKDIAAAISLDGSDRTSYVNRVVAEWRPTFPKKRRLDRVVEEENWFRDHTLNVHGEEAYGDYLVARHKQKSTWRVMRARDVLLMHKTEEKEVVVDLRTGKTKLLWDYDPDPADEYALRYRPNRFGSPTAPVHGVAGDAIPSSLVTPDLLGDEAVNDRLERIESKLDELLARVDSKPTDSEILETVEDFIESCRS